MPRCCLPKAEVGSYKSYKKGWIPRLGLELIKWQKRKGTHTIE
jgi:hypothetical protein